MRYYHYGNKNGYTFTKEERELTASGSISTDIGKQKEPYSSRLSNKSTLVIEDDTVYEIDEECLNCKR